VKTSQSRIPGLSYPENTFDWPDAKSLLLIGSWHITESLLLIGQMQMNRIAVLFL